MTKENKTQRAIRQRDEIIAIIAKKFYLYEVDEDNSWRVRHNLILLEMQLEPLLFNYFLQQEYDLDKAIEDIKSFRK